MVNDLRAYLRTLAIQSHVLRPMKVIRPNGYLKSSIIDIAKVNM